MSGTTHLTAEQLAEALARSDARIAELEREAKAIKAQVKEAREWLDASFSLGFTDGERKCWRTGMDILRSLT